MRKLNVIVIADCCALAAVLGTRRGEPHGVARRLGEARDRRRRRRRARSSSTRSRPRCTARSTRKPPALPAVPRATAAAAAPRVVYHRPPPIVVVKHTHHGDDGGYEHEGGERR